MIVFTHWTTSSPAPWFAEWLYRLGSGFASGSQLLELVPMGMNVDGATIARLLEGAEGTGWIKRTGPAPSTSQLFFGVPSVRRGLWNKSCGLEWYGFEPGEKYIEAWKFAEKFAPSMNEQKDAQKYFFTSEKIGPIVDS